jgi:hypothetical protein
MSWLEPRILLILKTRNVTTGTPGTESTPPSKRASVGRSMFLTAYVLQGIVSHDLGRPRVDTLKGSKHALIAKADSRFDAHLEKLPKKPGTKAKAKAGLRRRK